MVEVAAALRDARLELPIHVVGDGDARAGGARAAIARARPRRRRRASTRPPPSSPRWYAACDAAADDERVRGRPLRRLRGDGDGAAGRRAGAARQRRAARRRRRRAGRAARRRRRLRRRAAPSWSTTASAARRSAPRPRARAASDFSLAARWRDAHERALRRPARARAPPAPAGGGDPRRARERRSGCRSRRARARHAARLGDRPVLQPRPLPARVPRRDPRADATRRSRSIVVDDASTDPETLAVLDELERRGDVTRRSAMPRTAARAARATPRSSASRGRYVLPVDADNLLLPGRGRAARRAARGRRRATSASSTRTCSTSATATDYFEAPAYNLYALLQRQLLRHLLAVRPRGLRRGRALRREHPARPRGLGLRRCELADARRARRARRAARPSATASSGFTRSDAVEYARGRVPRRDRRERHPALRPRVRAAAGALARPARRDQGALVARAGRSSRSSPSTRREAGQQLAAGSRADLRATSSCVVRSIGDGRPRRRPSGAPDPGRAGAARPARRSPTRCRSPRAAACSSPPAPGSELLARPRLRREAAAHRSSRGHPRACDAIVLADAGAGGSLPAASCSRGDRAARAGRTLLLVPGARSGCPSALGVDARRPGRLARARAAWRPGCASSGATLPAPERPSEPRRAPQRRASRSRRPRRRGERVERDGPGELAAGVPAHARDPVRALGRRAPTWTPPETLPCAATAELGGERADASPTTATPPPGFALEYDLGAVHRSSQPAGTAELPAGGPEDGSTLTPDAGGGEPAEPRPAPPGHARATSSRRRSRCSSALHARLPPARAASGCSSPAPDDPLWREVERARDARLRRGVSQPTRARAPHADRTFGLLGARAHASTARARRHRVRGRAAARRASSSAELGALHAEAAAGSIPVWLDDDRLVTGDAAPAAGAARARRPLRWAAAPLALARRLGAAGAARAGRRAAAAASRACAARRAAGRAPDAATGGLPVGRRRRRAVPARAALCRRTTRSPATSSSRHGRSRRPTWATASRSCSATAGPRPRSPGRSDARRSPSPGPRASGARRAAHDRSATLRHRTRRRRDGVRPRGRRAPARRRAPRARRRRPRRRSCASPTTCPPSSTTSARPSCSTRADELQPWLQGPFLPRRRPGRSAAPGATTSAGSGFGDELPRGPERACACSTSAPTPATTRSCSRLRGATDVLGLRAVRVHRAGALPGGDLPHRRRLPAAQLGGPRPRACTGRFDLVHCHGVLYHEPHPMALLQRLRAMLAAGRHAAARLDDAGRPGAVGVRALRARRLLRRSDLVVGARPPAPALDDRDGRPRRRSGPVRRCHDGPPGEFPIDQRLLPRDPHRPSREP